MSARAARAVGLPLALLAIFLLLASSTATATKAAEPAALERQWAIAAGAAVKIEIKKDGWYRVPRSRLMKAGADLATPSRLHLYADGEEVPIRIGRGALEFYGQGVDTPSTDTRTYWLVRGAAGGLRIPVVGAWTKRRSGFARSFSFTLERKYRTRYVSLQNGERENFFGETINPKPTTLTLAARDLAQATGSLELIVDGLSQQIHQVKVVLNGTEIGKIVFRAQVTASKRFRLPRGVLHEGANSLTLAAVGGELDFSFIDTIRLTYPRRYEARHDALRFSLGA